MSIPLLLPPSQQPKTNRNLFFDPGTLYGRPALCGMPGLVPLTWAGATPSGMVQGIYHNVYGGMFVVVGGDLHTCALSDDTVTISDTDTLTNIGTDNPVQMAMNDNSDLIIAEATSYWGVGAAPTMWHRASGGAMTELTATGVQGGSIAYLDRMFLTYMTGTGTIVTPSDLSEAAWDDYDGFKPGIGHDYIINVAVLQGRAYVFGERTTEVTYNTQNSSGPLGRIYGATMDVGCGAPNSVARVGDRLYWLTHSGRIARTTGSGGHEIVSTAQLESVWGGYADTWDAQGFECFHGGHSFYAIRFGTGGMCFCFSDAAWEAGLYPWFEWTTGIGDEGQTAITACCSCLTMDALSSQPAMVYGDISNANLYVMDKATHTNNTAAFRTIWYPPAIREGGQTITHGAFEVMMKEGVGTGSQVLSYSDDRSVSWVTPTAITMVNADYTQKFEWFGLGSAEDRQYRWYCDAAQERVLFGANLRIIMGA